MPCPKSTSVGWLDKVKFIASYAINGCETTPQVYIRMGVAADYNLVAGFAAFSPTDFVYQWLRPKAGRVGRHGRPGSDRGNALGDDPVKDPGGERSGAAMPDPQELYIEAGESLTGLERPRFGEAGEYVFNFSKPILAVAYHLWVANMATDFAYDWWSGILLDPGSKCDRGRLRYESFYHDPAQQPYTILAPIGPVFPPSGAFWDGFEYQLGPGTWVVTLEMQIDSVHGTPRDATFFHQVRIGPGTLVQCGKTFIEDVPAGTIFFRKGFLMKVAGPESMNIYLAVQTASPGLFDCQYSLEFSAFVI